LWGRSGKNAPWSISSKKVSVPVIWVRDMADACVSKLKIRKGNLRLKGGLGTPSPRTEEGLLEGKNDGDGSTEQCLPGGSQKKTKNPRECVVITTQLKASRSSGRKTRKDKN